MIEVPGPEPDWEAAASCQGGKRNPAFQSGMWEYASSRFRIVAGLAAPLEPLAARLRLQIERSWEEPGPVDAAMFCIQRTDFALSRANAAHDATTYIWVGLPVSRSRKQTDAAIHLLLNALGLSPEALTFRSDPVTPEHPS
ncbi:hypothetical protein [Actinomadura oligospora]|uniref:hypothetical protein n=1 Tax=Actinomadura oligospora TaxID=111804 RepID=UPI00047AD637|nr:hypothetical protein [Actinomadura oligospora]